MLRLINTTDLSFHEFDQVSAPRYAIVSHRWGEDEVTHQEFLADHHSRGQGNGWLKIIKACHIARSFELSWVWIDTCCIDKKSSSELSEAVNSMYRWYYHSHECYAFLPDVFSTPTDEGFAEEFKKSVWFTRGWTLQEVLAPRRLLFYNAKFELIGDKRQRRAEVAAATGIHTNYLLGLDKVQDASIAERMKWAALRQSTRLEDSAYCLLGIFDVNMPLLYGEGAKAFVRLQLEIIKKTDDESIFAWWQDIAELGAWTGLLAPSPRAFASSPDETIKILRGHWRQPFSMTNKGLKLKLSVPVSLELSATHRSRSSILLPLSCVQITDSEDPLSSSGGDAPQIASRINQGRQIAIRLSIKATGEPGLRIVEGKRYRDRWHGEKFVLASSMFFEKPSTYGCTCIVGMADSKDAPLQQLTVYFKQDGI